MASLRGELNRVSTEEEEALEQEEEEEEDALQENFRVSIDSKGGCYDRHGQPISQPQRRRFFEDRNCKFSLHFSRGLFLCILPNFNSGMIANFCSVSGGSCRSRS